MKRSRWLLLMTLACLLIACSGALALAPATPTPSPTPTKTPTQTVAVTSTPSPAPTDTVTPTKTLRPTETSTPNDTPISTPTHTPTPQPPTATPVPIEPEPVAEISAAEAVTSTEPESEALQTNAVEANLDFRIASWRLWPLALNSGCAKGMHSIFITVLDVEGNPLNDIVVGDTWNNVEVMSGEKGGGKAEINLWTNTMEVTVKGDIHGNSHTSETSFPFSSYMTTIPNDQMIQAGYCSNEAECDWKRQHDSYYCGGHYSWEVVFQKTY